VGTLKNLVKSLDRGEVTNFSRSSYEVVFAVFMVALAYFYRNSPQIAYPTILYFFLLLLGANFAFNWALRSRAAVNLWLLDLILLANFWIITGVVYYSGGGASYFWTLYLLPVFAASLMASFKDAFGVVFLCVLAIGVMSWPLGGGELANVLGFAIKVAVLAFSAGVVYTTAQSRKRAEAGLAFKRIQVERLEREITEKDSELVKSATAAGVMHDLGNAVSVILLSAQIASEEESPDKGDLERILKAARFAKGVISNAFGLVRGQEYLFESSPLGEPIENAVLLTNYAARKKNVKVEVTMPAELPQLRLSKVHVERVFINTISNSLSFVPEKGSVRVSAAETEGGVLAEVADNGPGFPDRMLTEGVKAFGTTRKEKGGTGLGLYVCDQIMKRHGGWLKLSNDPAGGGRIQFFFPFKGP
jgi:signal transduction histidine kinase